MTRVLVHRAVGDGGLGRIVRSGSRVRAVVCPAMGASRYVARTVLAAMHHDGGLRAAMNIRYSKEVLKGKGLAVVSFDRAYEPWGVSTMECGTRTAIDAYRKLYKRVPMLCMTWVRWVRSLWCG